MKILLATVAALGLLAGSANAANLVLGFGTGASGGSEAQAGSQAGAGTVTGPIFGFAATTQNNNTQAIGSTTATGTTSLGGSTVNGTSVAGTNSTSSGAGFSLGFGASELRDRAFPVPGATLSGSRASASIFPDQGGFVVILEPRRSSRWGFPKDW
jgi:hypothetical protein